MSLSGERAEVMELWKSHVRAELFQRDCLQKDPFSGLFTKVSKLEELLNLHLSLWEDLERQSFSSNDDGIKRPVEGKKTPKLYLQFRQTEHIRQKLAQKVSDLTSDLYLREAELQFCHSQVARYRTEAVLLAKEACSLKEDLSDYQYKLECQSKELAALRLEQKMLKEELAATQQEKEGLLERWLEEKKEEAERLNKHNATQERWNRFAGQMNKHLFGGSHRQRRVASNSPQVFQRYSTEQSLPKKNK
ncbi:autophagy-related protein 16-1 [Pygocentrus nattereri]|uniref:autophagy-related protein 16-1 n=1 Tax=Pygocentrus nattereri TaxID=42514 RepID=UPI0008144C1C|nr:autophagy-related protein 16-1 [Pygocentrus nattereri]